MLQFLCMFDFLTSSETSNYNITINFGKNYYFYEKTGKRYTYTLFVSLLLIYRLSIVTVTYNNSNTIDKEHVFKDVENKEYTYHKI